MGQHHSHSSSSSPENVPDISTRRRSSTKIPSTAYVPALEKLFQKLELTAESDNGHPGELTRTTFENVFHGPLQLFGKLLYRQMVTVGHHSSDKIKERITCEQFVKAGREILKMFDETDQHKYYFKLFAEGKDHLTQDETLKMINIAYALTLSSSMIPYVKGPKDEKVFESVVQSMFGMKTEIKYHEMEKWMENHCPHMFCGVHNWVYTILTGSKMPTELEAAPVPMLDKFTEGKHCMTMGMLWMLTATLPYKYTHTEQEPDAGHRVSTTKNPLLTSYQFLMKLARLSRCQSWTTLYDSDDHGLSMNRFTHHITSYKDPTVTLISFEGRNIYCVAQDAPWREGSQKLGGDDAQLIQITPVYRVVKAKGPMVLWNMSDRNLPQGIYIGHTGKSNVVGIPADFSTLQHYGVDCELHRVEMWGCGGVESYQAQQKQKVWERKEVEKHRSRKLHLDTNWDENPDKQLLSWGGIETNHQYSRNGGM
ncbi:uncharacterized protein LOC123533745 [Mercenaria mercenaria]|uniref:uncharacterized protein LOC123533745 n=1 Tax=Mercenaria mercenaria TaxID=6596 RepID=UPI00234EE3DE|nr:uncharacterized protein LOC123533745 [Mercenaria mercenaria]